MLLLAFNISTSPSLALHVIQDAINDARSICLREYGASPEVTVYGDPKFVFPYVPSHLHHMVRSGKSHDILALHVSPARGLLKRSIWVCSTWLSVDMSCCMWGLVFHLFREESRHHVSPVRWRPAHLGLKLALGLEAC